MKVACEPVSRSATFDWPLLVTGMVGYASFLAIGAHALDAHPLAEQVKLDGRVAFGGAEADADGAFHGYALQSAVV